MSLSCNCGAVTEAGQRCMYCRKYVSKHERPLTAKVALEGPMVHVGVDPGVADRTVATLHAACYLCLGNVLEPMSLRDGLPYMRDPAAPRLCTGCRLQLGRPWREDEARWPVVEARS